MKAPQLLLLVLIVVTGCCEAGVTDPGQGTSGEPDDCHAQLKLWPLPPPVDSPTASVPAACVPYMHLPQFSDGSCDVANSYICQPQENAERWGDTPGCVCACGRLECDDPAIAPAL